MNRIYLVNILVYVAALLLIGLFDTTLELGQFQGMVFGLYMVYFGVVAFVVNAVLALIAYNKKRVTWTAYLLAGVLMLAASFLPGWILALGG